LLDDCSDEAIVVTNRLGVEVSKASLLEEEGRSANVDIVGEGRIPIPSPSDLSINIRNGVEVIAARIGVKCKSEFVNFVPPVSVGTGDFDVGVVHRPQCTERI